MTFDLKLWLVVGGLAIGLLGQLTDLLVCHWLPSSSSRAFCGAIVSEASTFGSAAHSLGAALGESDGGTQEPASNGALQSQQSP